MKLKSHTVNRNDIQRWLDKYQDKIKFIVPCSCWHGSNEVLIIIDES